MTGHGTSALVLGGGGITGIAWELGILTGLAREGVDLTGADVVVGTSAGSVVGAQVTGGPSLEELYATQLEPADAELGGRLSRIAALKLVPPYVLPGSGRDKLARVGRVALASHAPGSVDREAVIRSRLPVRAWPERDLRITAVDATSGEFTVFTADSGADLVAAVAASCAVPTVWPPVEIDGRTYMDGGMRSTANVDVAAGAERLVVLAPLPRSVSRKMSIRAQVERVAPRAWSVVTPDADALAAFGRNLLDPAKRAVAAEAGLRQSRDLVDRVGAVWAA
ncbi:patatin-like phospholipase family protein [Nocardioides sp. zg-1228]|uniref:patatin-like phospholipase family protein n=1 Tax=Nocardioides sp. zg-1228 TaxID=2763008 RepID=UPI0016431323|nr:patatin-like phospholipase family protein [Nocardioides sp. zg-1228]MBC2934445.1 patatin-like phospholipase family protein [Nocardioides sp. zg-1228]QSF59209.1 patatin-like phospholipase family protein [Nocardioides sp. zg-1228]